MAVDILSIILWMGFLFIIWIASIVVIKPIFIFIYYSIRHVKGYASYYTFESVYSTLFLIASIALIYLSFLHCSIAGGFILKGMCSDGDALLSRYSFGFFSQRASDMLGIAPPKAAPCLEFFPKTISDPDGAIKGSGEYPYGSNQLRMGFEYADTAGECHQGSSAGENVNRFYCNGIRGKKLTKDIDAEGNILSERLVTYTFDAIMKESQAGYDVLNITCRED